jgi:hypothetical protein
MLIEPKPKRARKCPHCRQRIVVRRDNLYTEAGAKVFEEQLEAERAAADDRERDRRQHEMRRLTAKQLKSDIEIFGDMLVGMRIHGAKGAFCCDFCQARDGKFIPIRNCTSDVLPPFKQCTNDSDGCLCYFEPVLREPR